MLRLAQLKKVSVNNSELASYTYDMNGLRTTKTVNNVTINYFYNNTVLMGFTDSNSNALLFSYDAAGQVQAVNFNGTYYYYLRNGQGDIVKLIDGSGNTVVEYAYDSWGKLLSCTGTLATTLGTLNPFRYRGYVYDGETQWYYLKSRYYDPETCRFISADVLLSTGQGVLGHNTYAYCLNNPVRLFDTIGYSPKDINITKGDGDGYGTGEMHSYITIYIVPMHEQGNAPLCWAYSQVMVEEYKDKMYYSMETVNARVEELARDAFGANYTEKWEKGSLPNNRRRAGIPARRLKSSYDLNYLLTLYGPMYACYYSDEGEGHCVVVTGVNVFDDIVYTNNPWGFYGQQSFEAFLNGFSVGEYDNTNYKLGMLYCIK